MKRWDVVAAALAAVALLAATAQVGIAVRAVPESLPEKLIAIAVVSPAVVLGLIVARRIPANPVGAVLVLIGAESLVDLTLEVWGQSGATASRCPERRSPGRWPSPRGCCTISARSSWP